MPSDKEIEEAVLAYYPGQTVHEAQRASVYGRMEKALAAAEQVRASERPPELRRAIDLLKLARGGDHISFQDDELNALLNICGAND